MAQGFVLREILYFAAHILGDKPLIKQLLDDRVFRNSCLRQMQWKQQQRVYLSNGVICCTYGKHDEFRMRLKWLRDANFVWDISLLSSWKGNIFFSPLSRSWSESYSNDSAWINFNFNTTVLYLQWEA